MRLTAKRSGMLTALALAVLAGPALADVKAGVDAWGRGDYDAAVAEWREPAAQGDPDAQFNLGQAYRLGRGVPIDQPRAIALYEKAAAQGHLKASDNLGLLLFQANERERAMPYIATAAERGDPRSQYLLGIAHFNGDFVEKDWTRAYALLTLANSAGLPQAKGAIQQMDGYIPLAEREAAQPLAQELKAKADTTRSQQLASADLVGVSGVPGRAAPAMPAATAAVPRIIPSAEVPASNVPDMTAVEAARLAVAEAARADGTGSPANAGADFAKPGRTTRTARAETPVPAPKPAATPAASAEPALPAATPAVTGPWRVQLGAFGVKGNAERLWTRVSGRPELAGRTRILEPAGRLTKLQAGGYGSRADAQRACGGLKAAGQPCIVTR